jgi:hypothetical protein
VLRLNRQVIEIKPVNMIVLNDASKKGDSKNEGKSVEVIENKCRKNVSLWL